ncbi:hypothetical protein CSOJ01_05697 [Colletotrichum sojae]|uniref:DUF6546 domain-containing protein n=1 Tax=Colletotrichum sojae TaxID=2175907 RepID=A0A8H6MWD9_9PEZI|nr:hypothetical protein CSOJ01_05697 [Colletotrichum sojae]
MTDQPALALGKGPQNITATPGLVWTSIPPELRRKIFEELARTGRGWSACASVCKEWQAELEKRNFRRLKVTAADLETMGAIIGPDRANLVRHVWLNIELLRYSCQASCSLQATKSFFFKNCYFGGEPEGWVFDPSAPPTRRPNMEGNLRAGHDEWHHWTDDRNTTAPSEYSLERIFGDHARFFGLGLPRTLRELSVFEETNEAFASVFVEGYVGSPPLPNGIRMASPQVGAAFATLSLLLEKLSVAFMVEAWDFF